MRKAGFNASSLASLFVYRMRQPCAWCVYVTAVLDVLLILATVMGSLEYYGIVHFGG